MTRAVRPSTTALVVALALTWGSACAGTLSDAQIRTRSRVVADATNDATTDAGNGVDPTADTPGAQAVTDSSLGTIAHRAGAAATAAGGRAIGTPGETGPVVVGSVGNYSGPLGAALGGIPKAVQVWAAAVNAAGGLFGRQVRVIVQDDGGDPARNASIVQDLVENHHVVAFVGQGAALSMSGGAPYLSQHHIPVVGGDCVAKEWFQFDDFFPQCAKVADIILGVMKLALRFTGQRRFGYVYCAETSLCPEYAKLVDQAAAQAGVEIVYKAQISLTQVDYTANCQNAKRAAAGGFAVVGDPNTLNRFVRSCERQDFRPQYVEPSLAVTGDSPSQPGLGSVGLVSFVFPWTNVPRPTVRDYAAAMDQYGGGPLGPATAQGWAAAKLFQLGAERAAAASGSLSSAALMAAFHTIRNETLGGLTVPLDFGGPIAHNAPCMFAMQGDQHGGWALPYGGDPIC